MPEDSESKVAIALPGEWALQKAFGPVLGELGEDLKRLYSGGRDRILAAGYKKVKDPNDGKKANLRVTRDVLWNGAFTDEEICAEYFGGILAAGRSEDGKDDDAVQFVDVIKSMSAKQLHLHYVIYTALNRILSGGDQRINVAQGTEIQSKAIYFAKVELDQTLGLKTDRDLNILHRQGLLNEYKTNIHTVGEKGIPFVMGKPTTFGVLLYSAAHNNLENWRSFDRTDFGEFEDIRLPKFYADSLEDLSKQVGLIAEADGATEK